MPDHILQKKTDIPYFKTLYKRDEIELKRDGCHKAVFLVQTDCSNIAITRLCKVCMPVFLTDQIVDIIYMYNMVNLRIKTSRNCCIKIYRTLSLKKYMIKHSKVNDGFLPLQTVCGIQLETKIKRIYSQHRQKESDIYHVKYT